MFIIWPTVRRPVWGLITGISLFSACCHVVACLSIDNDSRLCLSGKVSILYNLGLSFLILTLFALNCHLILNRSKFRLKVCGTNNEYLSMNNRMN